MLETGDGVGAGTTIESIVDNGVGAVDVITVSVPLTESRSGSDITFGGRYLSWVEGQIRYDVSLPNKPLGDTSAARVRAEIDPITGRIQEYIVLDGGSGYGRAPQVLVEKSRPQQAVGSVDVILQSNGGVQEVVPRRVNLVTTVDADRVGDIEWFSTTNVTTPIPDGSNYEENITFDLSSFQRDRD